MCHGGETRCRRLAEERRSDGQSTGWKTFRFSTWTLVVALLATRARQLELLEPTDEGAARDAEQLGRTGLVGGAAFEGGEDLAALGFFGALAQLFGLLGIERRHARARLA